MKIDPQITRIKKRGNLGDLRFRKTWDIIEAAEKGLLPDKIMINTHPQRWTDKPWPWVKELVWQNFKNVIKKGMIRMNSFGILDESLRDGWKDRRQRTKEK